MNTLAPFVPIHELDDDRRAALNRLDGDLYAVERAALGQTSESHEMLEVLRRRAVAVYQIALSRAAGVPYDHLWTVLSLTVAAFVACVGELEGLAPTTRAAERRLRALALETS
jgi:hypothetical protein